MTICKSKSYGLAFVNSQPWLRQKVAGHPLALCLHQELEVMVELFFSFDDTHSGVVKKVLDVTKRDSLNTIYIKAAKEKQFEALFQLAEHQIEQIRRDDRWKSGWLSAIWDFSPLMTRSSRCRGNGPFVCKKRSI